MIELIGLIIKETTMITAERLAEAIHQARHVTPSENLPCYNVPWHALSLHDKALALQVAEKVLEYLGGNESTLYKDVEQIKRTILSVKHALDEYCE